MLTGPGVVRNLFDHLACGHGRMLSVAARQGEHDQGTAPPDDGRVGCPPPDGQCAGGSCPLLWGAGAPSMEWISGPVCATRLLRWWTRPI